MLFKVGKIKTQFLVSYYLNVYLVYGLHHPTPV